MPSLIFILLRRMRTPLIVLITVFAIAVLGFVSIPGADAAGKPWHMGFFHAFYVVTYTATTIGFGELPFAFTDAQRIWMTVTVYLSVIGWLYSIGALFSIFQDPAFRRLLIENKFRRGVRRLREPFYLVCGYGDTGSILVASLTAAKFRVIVVDVQQDRIGALEIADLETVVPGLCADASTPDILLKAGLSRRNCVGVLALTNSDQVNVQIALTTKLLRPGLPIAARAEGVEAEASLRALQTVHVVNPFAVFAKGLGYAIHAPKLYALRQRLAGVDVTLAVPTLPRGRWILCGYGRAGQAIHQALRGEGIDVTTIEPKAELLATVPGGVAGLGTDIETLERAGVRDAQGVVAATDNDARNLCVVISARAMNPDLFVVARQNQRDNDVVFNAANLSVVMKHGGIVAAEVFSWLTAPLLADFLVLAEDYDEQWREALLRRIEAVVGDAPLKSWILEIRTKDAPALSLTFAAGGAVKLADIGRDTRDRDKPLPCLPLLLAREPRSLLLPSGDEVLHKGDRVLFCGQEDAERQMAWITRNHNVFHYVYTGRESMRPLLQRLRRRRA